MSTRLTLAFLNPEFTNQLEGYEGVTAQCHNCESHIRGPIGLWRCVVGVGGKREIEANSFGGGGYRWQLERALHYEMAVVYAVFCGMCALELYSERGRVFGGKWR